MDLEDRKIGRVYTIYNFFVVCVNFKKVLKTGTNGGSDMVSNEYVRRYIMFCVV